MSINIVYTGMVFWLFTEEWQVYLSYEKDSEQIVDGIYKVLTECGLKCWMEKHRNIVGDDLYKRADEGISKCKVFVAFVTQKYLECDRDIIYAHDRYKKEVLAVYLEDLNPHTFPGIMAAAMPARAQHVKFNDLITRPEAEWRDSMEVQELCQAISERLQPGKYWLFKKLYKNLNV